MHAPIPVPFTLLLHIYTNQRDPPFLCMAHSPFIILTTRDHFRGFKAPICHFNSILSLCHFVYGKLRDGAQAKILEAGATDRARKVALVMLLTQCSLIYCNQEREQRDKNLRGNPSPLDLLATECPVVRFICVTLYSRELAGERERGSDGRRTQILYLKWK